MPSLPGLRIAPSRSDGSGVFTDAPIAAGTDVLVISGPIVHAGDPATEREEARMYQIGPGRYISPRDPYGAFVNHSCEPNCWVRVAGDVATLVALRDVAAGEELVFDYATNIGLDDDWIMPCGCGTPACRGSVRSFLLLPEPLRERYEALGIVPGFAKATSSG